MGWTGLGSGCLVDRGESGFDCVKSGFDCVKSDFGFDDGASDFDFDDGTSGFDFGGSIVLERLGLDLRGFTRRLGSEGLFNKICDRLLSRF